MTAFKGNVKASESASELEMNKLNDEVAARAAAVRRLVFVCVSICKPQTP